MIRRLLGGRRAKVRRLTGQDAAIWRDLRLEALQLHPEAYGSTHDEWASLPIDAFAGRLEEGVVFGAFLDETLIGCMAIDQNPDTPERAELTAVYVQSAERRRGVAAALLAAAEREGRVLGARQFKLSVAEANAPALAFYRAKGFLDAGAEPRVLASNGEILELLRLVKRL